MELHILKYFLVVAREEQVLLWLYSACPWQENYLLVKETSDFSEKDYDLNDDGVLNVFDICLMKRAYIKHSAEDEYNILVAYFSATGNTEKIAQHIVTLTGADSYEIIPVIPYTAQDLNYSNSNCRANQEQNDKTSRPEIAGIVANMDNAVNGQTITATLENNTSAQAFAELLKDKLFTINLHDYGNFEKTGSLPQTLPRNDEPIDTDSGDLILYQGNQFVLYYIQKLHTMKAMFIPA